MLATRAEGSHVVGGGACENIGKGLDLSVNKIKLEPQQIQSLIFITTFSFSHAWRASSLPEGA